MSWYDSGSVAVTNGSTTVTGTGTNFITGAQAGEALYGPDDKLYEIASITSATALVLADAYLGSTQSGQDYKIVPTQSLVADLASDVTDLIADYADVKDKAGAGKFNDGSVTSPAITFEQDQNNGLYRIGSDNWGMSAGGQKQVDISTTDVELNYSGSKKLSTTSSGVDVTGTITADGFQLGAGEKLYFNADRYFTPENNIDGAEASANGNFTIKTGATPNKSLVVGSNGDVSFYEDTGTTAKMVWSSSTETLGVGNSVSGDINASSGVADVAVGSGSGTSGLTVYSGSDSYGALCFSDGTLGTPAYQGYIKFDHTNNALSYTQDNVERMRIDSAGNVGIGTDNPIRKLHIYESGTGNVGIEIDNPQVGEACTIGKQGNTAYGATGAGDTHVYTYDSNITLMADGGAGNASAIKFATGGSSERARIDSSGNLLVGTTSTSVGYDSADAGIALRGQSGSLFSRSNSFAISANRNGIDGDIVQFRKDGATVGSIGNKGGDLYIGTGDTGISFYDFSTDNALLPHNPSTNDYADGAVSFGIPSIRFKDLYLSGGVYLGGTGAANKLDDYEEGNWTPSIRIGSTSYSPSVTTQAKYVKVGKLVHVYVHCDFTGLTVNNGLLIYVAGLPFSSDGLQPVNLSISETYSDTNLFISSEAQKITGGTLENNNSLLLSAAGFAYVRDNAINSAGKFMFTASYKTQS